MHVKALQRPYSRGILSTKDPCYFLLQADFGDFSALNKCILAFAA